MGFFSRHFTTRVTMSSTFFDEHRFGDEPVPDPEEIKLLREKNPNMTIMFKEILFEIHTPTLITSQPPMQSRVDVTMDLTLPQFMFECPGCLTKRWSVFSSQWSDSFGVGKPGLCVWAQCAVCKLAFEVYEPPTFNDDTTFYHITPSASDVRSRVESVRAAGRCFPCRGTLSILTEGRTVPIIERNVDVKNITKRALYLVPQLLV
jgi:hypothetical protein